MHLEIHRINAYATVSGHGNVIHIGDYFKAIDARSGTCICQGKCTQIKNSMDAFGRKIYAISPDNVHFFTTWSPRIRIESSGEVPPIPFNDNGEYRIIKWRYQIAYDIEDVDIYLENGLDDIDSEVKSLVYELNQWEGIETTQSCCGHGKGHLWVKFYITSFQALYDILLPLRSEGSPLLDEFSLEIGSRLTEASIIYCGDDRDCKHDGIELTLATFSEGQQAYDVAQKYADTLFEMRMKS